MIGPAKEESDRSEEDERKEELREEVDLEDDVEIDLEEGIKEETEGKHRYMLRPNFKKKITVFRVTRPYLNLLVKPKKIMFSGKNI